MNSKIYCSLDIETSDFDPITGEVLEVGLVFFSVTEHAIEILEEWTTTCKPIGEVAPRILALTGISKEELEMSEPFENKKEIIQQKVAGAIIVGHSISFDTGFLEKKGITFSGQIIDTLDLAQIFLPTANSYNLESLMNLLGVDHKDAHRALADARATLVVLKKLIAFFCSFPEQAKKELRELYTKNDPLTDFLYCDLNPEIVSLLKTKFITQRGAEIISALKTNKGVVSFPLGYNHHQYVYGALEKTRQKYLLVVPSEKEVYRLWKHGLAEPFWEINNYFDEELFNKNKKNISSTQEKTFFSKMIVWKYTNWQHSCLVDLNFSFGLQFRSLAEATERNVSMDSIIEHMVVAMDYQTFIECKEIVEFQNRKLLILDIDKFESALTMIATKKVSWGDFLYSLKQYGVQGPSKIISDELLVATDLFFGLASMHMQKISAEVSQTVITPLIRAGESFEAIKISAQNFCDRVVQANTTLKLKKLEVYVDALRSFFIEDPQKIYWVEQYENRLTFFTSPIDLNDLSEAKLQKFKKVVFTASLGSDSLINYFEDRLALHDYEHVSLGQQELTRKFEVAIQPELGIPEKLWDLTLNLGYPGAILLGNQAAVKNFYEPNFLELQKKYKVFVQGFSGSTTKMLENFSIAENSLLVATDKFVLKNAGKHLKVKTLVITRLPFEQFSHPLNMAQAAKYENAFLEYNIPRALHNFHQIISFFYSDQLEKIYIVDQKIKKEYGKYFIEYLKKLPFVEIS